MTSNCLGHEVPYSHRIRPENVTDPESGVTRRPFRVHQDNGDDGSEGCIAIRQLADFNAFDQPMLSLKEKNISKILLKFVTFDRLNMKKTVKLSNKLTALFLGILLQGAAFAQDETVLGQKPLKDFSKLKSGDLVFIRSSSGDRADAIERLTKSPLTHCGIVINEGRRWIVYEGAGHIGDYKDVKAWQIVESTKQGGHPPAVLHLIYVRRYSGSLEGKLDGLRRKAKELHDTPYDNKFAWNNHDPSSGKEYIYCSELMWKAFHDAVGIDLGTPHPLKDYLNQASKEDKPKVEADFKHYLGDHYDPEEKAISPSEVFKSDELIPVTDDTPVALTPSARSAEFTVTEAVKHAGAADGSAGIAVGEDHFIGASDENNVLRLYSSDSAETGKELLDLNPLLGFEKEDGEFKECDIEGAAQMDDLIFWIGSHGLNKKGHVKESRRVLFATALSGSGADAKLTLKGAPCKSLMDAFMAILELKKTAGIKPEEEGGLNIESLCANGSSLLIGFRNPVSAQGALVVPLINPREVIAGKPPMLGQPFRLELGGRGIRDMTNWQGQFLIVAGDYKDRTAPGAKTPKLFRWSGDPNESPVPMKGELGDLNPEAALVYGQAGKETLQLLSDDGGGSFRSVWLKMDGAH
jgi:uncharacterized protein YycO